MTSLQSRYVDLLKNALLGDLYLDDVLRVLYLRECVAGKAKYDSGVFANIRRHDPARVPHVIESRGRGLPYYLDFDNLVIQHTMVGRARLDHVERCFHSIISEGVPGDFMECGVWRGGVVILLRALLDVFEVPDRLVWAMDSFRGLPPPTAAPDVAMGVDFSSAPMLAAGLDEVRRHLEAYGYLDDRVQLVAGWFRDTAKTAPPTCLAMLRLDGDMYESTRDALEGFYDRLAPGGYCIIDDYFAAGCRQAVDEFRAMRGCDEPLEPVDWAATVWRRRR